MEVQSLDTTLTRSLEENDTTHYSTFSSEFLPKAFEYFDKEIAKAEADKEILIDELGAVRQECQRWKSKCSTLKSVLTSSETLYRKQIAQLKEEIRQLKEKTQK
jgi:predicted  nucleic acid-binding Zn-ribbon protein